MALAFEHLDFELCLTFELWPLFVIWILSFELVQALPSDLSFGF